MFRQACGRGALALALAVILGGPALAHAQTGEGGRLTYGGMDLHLFRPAVDSKGHLSVNGTDILPHLGISFGLVLDGGFGILPFSGFVNNTSRSATDLTGDYCGIDTSDLLCGRLVAAQLTGALHFNVGLFNLLVVGAQ